MITALVQFDLPHPITPKAAQAIFASTAPRYQGMEGLVRKYYLLSEDGRTAGGVYLWRSRAAAERVYDDAWKAFVRDKYGSEARVTFFATPVVVDNASNEIVQTD